MVNMYNLNNQEYLIHMCCKSRQWQSSVLIGWWAVSNLPWVTLVTSYNTNNIRFYTITLGSCVCFRFGVKTVWMFTSLFCRLQQRKSWFIQTTVKIKQTDSQNKTSFLSSAWSWCCYCSNMTLNMQKEKHLLERRSSTSLPLAHFLASSRSQPDPDRPPNHVPPQDQPRRRHRPLGQSVSYHPGDKPLNYGGPWSSDSDSDSQSDSGCVYRVLLLGDHSVGKTSLAGIFAGVTDKDEQFRGDRFMWDGAFTLNSLTLKWP